MDRKRKLSICYSARHKRRLISRNTLIDVKAITHQTEHSTTVNNNNQLDIDEHDDSLLINNNLQVANLDLNQSTNDEDKNEYLNDYNNVDKHNTSLLICNPQVANLDTNQDQLINNNEDNNVQFLNEDNTCIAQSCRNANSNQIIDDTALNHENLNDKTFMRDLSTWAINENISHSALFYKYYESTLSMIYLKIYVHY